MIRILLSGVLAIGLIVAASVFALAQDDDPDMEQEDCFVEGRDTNWCIP